MKKRDTPTTVRVTKEKSGRAPFTPPLSPSGKKKHVKLTITFKGYEAQKVQRDALRSQPEQWLKKYVDDHEARKRKEVVEREEYGNKCAELITMSFLDHAFHLVQETSCC